MKVPNFKTKKELFKFLVENKNILVADKMAELKHADGILFNPGIHYNALSVFDTKSNSFKAVPSTGKVDTNASTLEVRAVINCCNWLDSHRDVHLNGLWKKSLSEWKLLQHLQEHVMAFDHIISNGDDLKGKTEKISWKELGMNYPGDTECLVFYSTVKKSRNPFMFEQYAQKYVTNHSVGMRYVQFVMCIDDEDYGAEYEAWEKYADVVVNKEELEQGYFWAVKEAKAFEGSAVVLGSNIVTPTLSTESDNESKADKDHFGNGEPTLVTQLAKNLASKLVF